MKLTKKKAIEISIELWTWMADTGRKCKRSWTGWEKYGRMQDDCALCEYTKEPLDACNDCPTDCYESAFYDWRKAENKGERKKYAALFLAELKELK